MSTPPRIACVGAGQWGKNLVRNFHALGSLASICETDSERVRWLQEQYPDVPVIQQVDDVLADQSLAGLAIATPAESHGEIVRKALEAGKDVFVEKPLCLDVSEGAELVRLADDRGQVLMVGHVLWYHPAVRKLKEIVDGGELGRLQYVASNRLNLGKIRTVENILWSFAPHDISVLLGLSGEMPSDIRAQGANLLHERIADVTTSFFTFPSGLKAHIFVSWLHPFKEQRLVVVGDQKMAVFDDLEPEHKLVIYPHSVEWRNRQPVASRGAGEPVRLELEEPLRTECAHFLGCIEDRSVPDTDGHEALRVLRVLTECQSQLDQQDRIPPPVLSTDTVDDGTQAPFFVHPSSYVDEDVSIGRGTYVWHFSHLMPGTVIGEECRIGQNVVIGPRVSIGDGVKIQNNVSVYEGVTLEDYVFCGPSMVFTNVYNPRSEIRRMDELRQTLVKTGASLGANCTIVCGITIGRYAFVGAGAVVNADIPNHALVVGNPAKIIGWVCRCGHRVRINEPGATGTCPECSEEYELSQTGLTRSARVSRL